MKKLKGGLFASKRRSTEGLDATPSAPTDTLNRIVIAKEEAQRKWEVDEEEHRRRKRDHEISMIEMEQAEVNRREKEVEKLNALLQDTRRKNQQVVDKVNEQIEILKVKLEEYKLDHKKHESSIEDDIAAKNEKKSQVQSTLDQRRKALEIDFPSDAIDGEQENLDEAYTENMYAKISRPQSMVDRQRAPTPPSPYSSKRWNSAATLPLSNSPNMSNSLTRIDSIESEVYPKIDYEATASDEERLVCIHL